MAVKPCATEDHDPADKKPCATEEITSYRRNKFSAPFRFFVEIAN